MANPCRGEGVHFRTNFDTWHASRNGWPPRHRNRNNTPLNLEVHQVSVRSEWRVPREARKIADPIHGCHPFLSVSCNGNPWIHPCIIPHVYRPSSTTLLFSTVRARGTSSASFEHCRCATSLFPWKASSSRGLSPVCPMPAPRV